MDDKEWKEYWKRVEKRAMESAFGGHLRKDAPENSLEDIGMLHSLLLEIQDFRHQREAVLAEGQRFLARLEEGLIEFIENYSNDKEEAAKEDE